ncbi:MAG TPA: FAD-dependent oxidoreductase [Rhodanobacter sp.]|nr:FAD-dependent oxidoreductase [Rhodanobacter sp.]
MNHYDLIVVGAGIIGAACADCASAEGMKVAVVEPGSVGGGSTASSMGHLVALDGLPAELTLAKYSMELWQSLADLPQAEYHRCGTLWVAVDDADLARIPAKLARLAAAGVVAEAISASSLRRLEPELIPGLAGGVLVPDDATVFPPAVAMHLVERACRRGVVRYRDRVMRLEAGGVSLHDGSRLHGPVLVATGCALGELLPTLPLRLRKGHLVITDRYPGRIRHQLLQLGYADSAHGEADSSVAFNVQPRPGGQLLIGSSRENCSTTREVSMPMVQRMLQRAFEFLPGLRPLQALRIWTGLRPVSVDGLPYLGRVPDRPGVWVAAGHEGLGITTSLGSARLLVDQLLGREPAIDPRPYDPARVAA